MSPLGSLPVAVNANGVLIGIVKFGPALTVGQLLFVAAVLTLVAGARRIPMAWPLWAGLVPPYAIGSLAMFWMIQRVVAF